MNETVMEAEVNGLDDTEDKKKSKLSIGKKFLPPISSDMKLDSLMDKNIDYKEIFESEEFQKVVVSLSVRFNNLSEFPEKLTEKLTNLTKLNISHNCINELDTGFEALVNLRELIIDKNQIDQFPDCIGGLINLRLISARGNKLLSIPDNFVNLLNIEDLDLSGNLIKSLTESLGKLEKLKHLRLSNNELRSVPKCITEGLAGLETLDLSQNYISELTAPLSNNLKILHFANNPRNDQFPGWLLTQRLSKLEEIVLDNTVFSSFDIPDISTPSNVKHLSMVQCGMSDTSFEQISRHMIDLEYLNIGNQFRNHEKNIFWVMPAKGFTHPEKLFEFCIESAGLPAVPREINLLVNLTRLNVSRNGISSLPEEICELNKLEILNAAHNKLYALPEAIGNLKALRIMFLENNGLSSLPDSVEYLEHLECLDLYNNEFLEVPEQLGRIPNLKALDVEGNIFKTDNLEIANIEYLRARDNLRSTSNILLSRSNDPKIFDEPDSVSTCSSLNYETEYPNVEETSMMDLNLSDIDSVENWDSEDSTDEFDPTVKRRTYQPYTPFTVSSYFCYGNFCPADLHTGRIRDQLAASNGQAPSSVEEGQFDDA